MSNPYSVSAPPRLANWLLLRLGAGYHRDALLGDLLEEYELGRSRRWYWWQVLNSIAVGLRRSCARSACVWLHGLVAGWAGLTAAICGANFLQWQWMLFLDSARRHRPWQSPTLGWFLLQWTPWLPLLTLGCVGAGWLLGQYAGPRHRPVTLVIVLTMLAWKLPWVCRLAVDMSADARFAPWFAINTLELLLSVGALLFGLSSAVGVRRRWRISSKVLN